MHYHKLLVKTYNRISEADVEDISEIPNNALTFLYLFSSKELVSVHGRDMLSRGVSLRGAAQKLNVTKRVIDNISVRMK